MNTRTIGKLSLLLSLLFMLAGCGGDNNNGGDSGSFLSVGDLLPQTFSAETVTNSENSPRPVTLTFNYPEGWVMAYADDQIAIANSQTVLDGMTSGSSFFPGAGQIGGNLFFAETMSGRGLEGLVTGASPAEIVAAFAASYDPSEEYAMFGPEVTTDTFTINGLDGASIGGQVTPDGGERYDEIYVFIQVENGYMLGFFGAMAGELEQFIDELRAITASGVAVITPTEQ